MKTANSLRLNQEINNQKYQNRFLESLWEQIQSYSGKTNKFRKKRGEEKKTGLVEPFFKKSGSEKMMRNMTITRGCSRMK